VLASEAGLADRYLSKGKAKAQRMADSPQSRQQRVSAFNRPIAQPGPSRPAAQVPLFPLDDLSSVSSRGSSPDKSRLTSPRPGSPKKGEMSPILRKKVELFGEPMSASGHARSYSLDDLAQTASSTRSSALSSRKSAGDLIKQFELNVDEGGRLSPSPVLGLKDWMKHGRVRLKTRGRDKGRGRGSRMVVESREVARELDYSNPPAPPFRQTEPKAESETSSILSGSTAAEEGVCFIFFLLQHCIVLAESVIRSFTTASSATFVANRHS
jgi:hypothetical protein